MKRQIKILSAKPSLQHIVGKVYDFNLMDNHEWGFSGWANEELHDIVYPSLKGRYEEEGMYIFQGTEERDTAGHIDGRIELLPDAFDRIKTRNKLEMEILTNEY